MYDVREISRTGREEKVSKANELDPEWIRRTIEVRKVRLSALEKERARELITNPESERLSEIGRSMEFVRREIEILERSLTRTDIPFDPNDK